MKKTILILITILIFSVLFTGCKQTKETTDQQALEIALEDANLKQDEVTDIKITGDEAPMYVVEFTNSGKRIVYTLDMEEKTVIQYTEEKIK